MGSYRGSKLWAVTWAAGLARRAPHLRVRALHPGVVDTGMGRKDAGWLVKAAWAAMTPLKISPDRAAENVWHALTAPDGFYFNQKEPTPAAPQSRDADLQDWVWAWTEQALERERPSP